MKWNDNYIPEMERTIGQRVQAAGYFLVSRIRENISIPGTKVAGSSFVGTGVIGEKGKRYRKGRRIYGANPSKPGEFPHKQRGLLRMSIAQDFDPAGPITRVGTASKIGKWLELGTAKMLPRPWLRRTLAEERQNIVKTISGEKPN